MSLAHVTATLSAFRISRSRESFPSTVRAEICVVAPSVTFPHQLFLPCQVLESMRILTVRCRHFFNQFCSGKGRRLRHPVDRSHFASIVSPIRLELNPSRTVFALDIYQFHITFTLRDVEIDLPTSRVREYTPSRVPFVSICLFPYSI